MIKKSSTGKIGRGRIAQDIKMTTEEIEYHTHIQEWYIHLKRPDMIAQQERIIRQRKQHLKKLRERDSRN